MSCYRATTCRTRIPLTHTYAGEPVAHIAWLSARAVQRRAHRRALSLVWTVGRSRFHAQAMENLNEVVAPLALTILGKLGLRPHGFEISVSPPGAITGQDLPAVLEGRSAEAACLLVMVGAGGGPEPLEGVLATGCIDSTAGELSMVAHVDLKLDAAGQSGEVTTFVMPRIAMDGTIAQLTPEYYERILYSRARWVRSLNIVEVSDIAELFDAATDPRALVKAALESGYYSPDLATHPPTTEDPVSRTVTFLREGNAKRFQQVLEAHLQDGDHHGTAGLLGAFAAFHLARRRYPMCFGFALWQLLRSLAGTVRRRLRFPLLPYEQAMSLVALAASEDDRRDALVMLESLHGRHLDAVRPGDGSDPASRRGDGDKAARDLNWVCQQISRENLDRLIGIPMSQARESFKLDSIQAKSHEDYLSILASFYVHLGRHTGLAPVWQQPELIAGEAVNLVAEAFADQGGPAVAEALARSGRLPLVLDRLSQHQEQHLVALHVNCVIKEVLDALDPQGQLDFIKALMDRLGDQLPPDVRSQPPQHFVTRLELLVRRYVQSRDRVVEAFRGY